MVLPVQSWSSTSRPTPRRHGSCLRAGCRWPWCHWSSPTPRWRPPASCRHASLRRLAVLTTPCHPRPSPRAPTPPPLLPPAAHQDAPPHPLPVPRRRPTHVLCRHLRRRVPFRGPAAPRPLRRRLRHRAAPLQGGCGGAGDAVGAGVAVGMWVCWEAGGIDVAMEVNFVWLQLSRRLTWREPSRAGAHAPITFRWSGCGWTSRPARRCRRGRLWWTCGTRACAPRTAPCAG